MKTLGRTDLDTNRDEGLSRDVEIVAGVIVLGVIMSVLDTTIVNVALDTLSQDLHSPLSTIQWTSVINSLQRLGGSIGTALLTVVLLDQVRALAPSAVGNGGLTQTLSPAVRAQVAARPSQAPSATPSGGRSARHSSPSSRRACSR